MKHNLISEIQSVIPTARFEEADYLTDENGTITNFNAGSFCKQVDIFMMERSERVTSTGDVYKAPRWSRISELLDRPVSFREPWITPKEAARLAYTAAIHLKHGADNAAREQALRKLADVMETAGAEFITGQPQFAPGWVPTTEEAFLQAFTSICDLRRQSTALQQQVKVLEAKAKHQETRLDDIEGLFTCPPDWSDTTTYICNKLGLPTRKFGAVIINGHCCHGPSSAGRYIASLWRDEMGTEPRTHHCANSRETYKIYPFYFLKVFEIKLPAWVKESYTGDTAL